MTKERRLGRGLEALLGKAAGEFGEGTVAFPSPEMTVEGAVTEVDVQEIVHNPYQPRETFDEQELRDLAASLREHGLIQPVVVRRAEGKYQLISGERRLRAAIQSGWTRIPVHVREVDDRQLSEWAIVENLHRKDLNPLEKAASFQQYLERYRCTQEELAQRLQLDRSTIANLIRLLDLSEEVQHTLRDGTLTQGHARALLPLEADDQCTLAARIREEGLSVRETERIVQEYLHGPMEGTEEPENASAPIASRRAAKSPQLESLEQEFRELLGMKAELRQGRQGRGKLIIHFRHHEEFERLRDWLHETSGAAAPSALG